MEKRKQSRERNYTPHCFSGRIFCDECGALYGSKVWNSRSKYKTTVWQCNGKYRGYGQKHCSAPTLRAETIEDAFIAAINQLLANKHEIIQVCEQVMLDRCDTSALCAERIKLESEREIIQGLMERLVSMNAAVAMDQEEYSRQFGEYDARYNAAKSRIEEINAEEQRLTAKRGTLLDYLKTLREQNLIQRFDERLWYGTVDQVHVTAEGRLRFIFKGGQEITV